MSTALKVVRTAPPTFTVSFFDGKSDNKPKPQPMTWPALVARFSHPAVRRRKDGELFSPATFNGTRAKDKVESVSMLVLDYDHEANFGRDIQVWQEQACAFIAYTTYSHSDEAHRFRVVMPLDVPIPADVYPLLWQWAHHLSGDKIDRAASDASRMFYTPAVARKDAAWRFEEAEGAFLDWRTLELKADHAHTNERAKPKLELRQTDGALHLNPDAEPPHDKFARLCESVPSFLQAWNHRRPMKELKGSPSSYDLALANDAVDAGWSDQEIADLLIAHRRKHNARSKNLQYYLTHTIEKARTKIAARAATYPLPTGRTPDGGDTLTVESERAIASAGSLSTVEPRTFNQSDYGNAERLVYRHGADLRFDHTSRKWFVWDGKRWREDATAEATRRAKETVRAMYVEAAKLVDEKERKAFVKFALSSEAEARITAMLSSASSENGVHVLPDELDADPFLLNCANGTLDLRTGILREHKREDLMTKLSPVAYDEGARDETWEKFLHDSTGGDAELQTFLQRAAGYSLTGDTREEVLFFIHGPAAAGKSTFVDALKTPLGENEYAKTADFEAFLSRHHVGGPRSDIAELAGSRFVSSIEVDEGKKLAEGLVKMLTGGDIVKARFLYQNLFAFRPAFKLWLVANHTPKVRDDDEAMWRRILTVPFVYTVEKSKRDPRVKAHLRDVTKAGPAIMAWMVRGCLDWQRDGLRVPQAVEDATAEYRESQDPLKDFLSECCVLTPAAWISTADLRAEYERFAKERGERHLLMGNNFTDRLKLAGCENCKRNGVRGWQGIGLLASD